MNNYIKLKNRGLKYEIDKFGFKKRVYKIKSSTKKCKELMRKIEKADKQIIKAKLLCIEERKKLRNKQLNDKVKKIAKIKKQMNIKGVQDE